MKLGIVGYGKMGRLVESLAREQGMEVAQVVDPCASSSAVTARDVDEHVLEACDVLVEFSNPDAIFAHLAFYAAHPCRVVVGTTGWNERMDEVEELMASSASSIIYSGNYSLGVAVFLRLVGMASCLLDAVGGYDAGVMEMHHRMKADAPSGTALMVASEIASNCRQHQLVTELPSGGRGKDDLQVSSLRVGTLCGTHTAIFDSDADTLELTHRARTRGGFAKGALMAARWIMDQKPGLYTLQDLVGGLFENGTREV